MTGHTEIWRVTVNDGTAHYFDSKSEADFLAKDTVEAGFTAYVHPIPLPRTAKEFVVFMEEQERQRRHAETALAAVEAVTPNWRGFRSLAEAVEVAVHAGQRR